MRVATIHGRDVGAIRVIPPSMDRGPRNATPATGHTTPFCRAGRDHLISSERPWWYAFRVLHIEIDGNILGGEMDGRPEFIDTFNDNRTDVLPTSSILFPKIPAAIWRTIRVFCVRSWRCPFVKSEKFLILVPHSEQNKARLPQDVSHLPHLGIQASTQVLSKI
jgi:hypothetical protein